MNASNRARPNLEYKDWKIPPGTHVSMTRSSMFHAESNSPDSWPFSPERFLDPGAKKRSEQYFAPFGRCPEKLLGEAVS